ncbi:MAG: delta-60 repeat domain-containing protein, partial [Verrucomicrobiota bacterium]
AGQFTQVGSSNRVNIARLNFDGSLDSGFDPGIGPDGPIYTIGVQKDGQVLIGGAFNNVNGFSTPGIARLNGDKTVPATVELSDISILDGTLIFDFNTVAGSVYTVETSSDLKTWETLRTITANGDNTQFTEQVGNNRKLFYRIRLAQ